MRRAPKVRDGQIRCLEKPAIAHEYVRCVEGGTARKWKRNVGMLARLHWATVLLKCCLSMGFRYRFRCVGRKENAVEKYRAELGQTDRQTWGEETALLCITC